MLAKIGLELHIQIHNRKLFCRCTNTWQNIDYTFENNLQNLYAPTHSTFKYAADSRLCRYELDQELPIKPRATCLKIAKAVAEDLGMRVEKNYTVYRKHILDGSLVPGFQRTGIYAKDGKLGSIAISELRLEEDSCKKLEPGFFSVCRQGTPLLEIVTEPILVQNAGELQNIVDVLYTLSATVRKYTMSRGIGTIRQDVNVYAGLGKTELKGFQDVKMHLIPSVLNEIKRQTIDDKRYSYHVDNMQIKITLASDAAAMLICEYINNCSHGFHIFATQKANCIHYTFTEKYCHNSILGLLNRYTAGVFESTRKVNTLDHSSSFMRGKQSKSRYIIECLIPPVSLQDVPIAQPYTETIYPPIFKNWFLEHKYSKRLQQQIYTTIQKHSVNYPHVKKHSAYILQEYHKGRKLNQILTHDLQPFTTALLDIAQLDYTKPLGKVLFAASAKFKYNIVDYTVFQNAIRSKYNLYHNIKDGS